MKNKATQLLFLIPLALSLLIGPPIQAEERTAGETVQAWAASFNGNNAQRMSDFYEESEEVDMLVSVGLWHRGITGVREAYLEDEENWHYYDSGLKNLRVRDLGEVALASFEHQFKLHSLEDGVRLQIHVRTTMALRKVGNEWKIASEHSSGIRGTERVTVISR